MTDFNKKETRPTMQRTSYQAALSLEEAVKINGRAAFLDQCTDREDSGEGLCLDLDFDVTVPYFEQSRVERSVDILARQNCLSGYVVRYFSLATPGV